MHQVVFTAAVVLISGALSSTVLSQELRSSLTSTVNVVGAVKKPGSFLVENHGLVHVVNLAGGFNSQGCPSRATLSGSLKGGETFAFRIDIREIIESNLDDYWIPDGFQVDITRSDWCWGEKINQEITKYLHRYIYGGYKSFNMSGVHGIALMNGESREK